MPRRGYGQGVSNGVVSSDEREKEHKDFLTQYVLNSASNHRFSPDVVQCVDHAEEAWIRIKRIANQDHGPTPAREPNENK